MAEIIGEDVEIRGTLRVQALEFVELPQAPDTVGAERARLYYDSANDAVQLATNGGGDAALSGLTTALIEQADGTVAVDSDGAITATPADSQATTLSGGDGNALVLGGDGAVDLHSLNGAALAITGSSGGGVQVATDGSLILSAPATAPADGTLAASALSLWLDEENGALVVKLKDSGGTVQTVTLAFDA